MPNRPHFFSTAALTNAAESAVNTETVVATLTNVITEYAGQGIKVEGWLQVTPGTTATSATFRLRRGGLAGALVSAATAESGAVAAAKPQDFTIECEDTPGEGNFTYVLTMQGAGEGTVATFQATELKARVD